jgi:hypothetical protein
MAARNRGAFLRAAPRSSSAGERRGRLSLASDGDDGTGVSCAGCSGGGPKAVLRAAMAVGALAAVREMWQRTRETSFAGERALVTGAGSGLGRELALLLAAEGCTSFVLWGRRLKPLQARAAPAHLTYILALWQPPHRHTPSVRRFCLPFDLLSVLCVGCTGGGSGDPRRGGGPQDGGDDSGARCAGRRGGRQRAG